MPGNVIMPLPRRIRLSSRSMPSALVREGRARLAKSTSLTGALRTWRDVTVASGCNSLQQAERTKVECQGGMERAQLSGAVLVRPTVRAGRMAEERTRADCRLRCMFAGLRVSGHAQRTHRCARIVELRRHPLLRRVVPKPGTSSGALPGHADLTLDSVVKDLQLSRSVDVEVTRPSLDDHPLDLNHQRLEQTLQTLGMCRAVRFHFRRADSQH